MNVKPLRFLVVEDHPEVAQNNCDFLTKFDPAAICVIASTPQAAMERLKIEIPDLIVLDLQFTTSCGSQSVISSLEMLQSIFNTYSSLNILIYSSEPGWLIKFVKYINHHCGGFVVVNKMERRKYFLEGVESALNGELKLPRELRQELNLNEKELEILRLLCYESLTDQAIAHRLHISLRVVQNHIQHLKVKLGVDEVEQKDINSRIALCMTAIQKKLLLF
ncbi:response regulator transcription factor [Sphaerospermopsis kisseleviana CS-549]|uniref:Response regulator transcription factor n=1 Tax=Sphaerospermopsis kisseleviana CS-549 TaxID=3021783 RepID=A0ABT4ZWP4_9CYAN|nr:response regulator transcription factor [Sphaerospermopsis kisseleviana]MDB9443837.1 response regulator transcription factor [Sphaerospermopsis kisseleviana CS-549]BAZ80136.1 response regulator [Sphaerospermopsis kisseleviana NIES-73]